MKRLAEGFIYEGSIHPVRKRSSPIPNPVGHNAYFHCFGLLVSLHSLWVGAHYSSQHKRLCINILPCVTLWWTKPGGTLP